MSSIFSLQQKLTNPLTCILFYSLDSDYLETGSISNLTQSWENQCLYFTPNYTLKASRTIISTRMHTHQRRGWWSTDSTFLQWRCCPKKRCREIKTSVCKIYTHKSWFLCFVEGVPFQVLCWNRHPKREDLLPLKHFCLNRMLVHQETWERKLSKGSRRASACHVCCP